MAKKNTDDNKSEKAIKHQVSELELYVYKEDELTEEDQKEILHKVDSFFCRKLVCLTSSFKYRRSKDR